MLGYVTVMLGLVGLGWVGMGILKAYEISKKKLLRGLINFHFMSLFLFAAYWDELYLGQDRLVHIFGRAVNG